MKLKIFIALLLCLTILFLTSCSGAEQGTENSSEITSISSTAQDQIQAGKIDVDLTKLSSTMVYSKVYDMVTKPEDYVGKQVKMTGLFAVYNGTEYRDHYFACVVSDATACCQQGIEFRLADERTYPDDYPEVGTSITVVGTFNIYMEGETQYIELIDSKLS